VRAAVCTEELTEWGAKSGALTLITRPVGPLTKWSGKAGDLARALSTLPTRAAHYAQNSSSTSFSTSSSDSLEP
jgi:hypothetical protein